MINNIAYFPSQCAQNSRPVMSAVLDYLQARGIQTQENSMESDAAVIWSVLWVNALDELLFIVAFGLSISSWIAI